MFELASPELLLLIPIPIAVIKFIKNNPVANKMVGLKLPFIQKLTNAVNNNQIIVSQRWAKYLLIYFIYFIGLSLNNGIEFPILWP